MSNGSSNTMDVDHSFVEKVMDVYRDKVVKSQKNYLENNETTEVKKKLEKLETQIEEQFSYLQRELSYLVKQRSRSISINNP